MPEPAFRRVDHVQLVRREVREYVPRTSLELLFRSADVVFEGEAEPAGAGGDGVRIAGTLMVTMDLSDVAALAREPADAATAARLAELLPRTEGFVAGLAGLAAREIERASGTRIDPKALDLDPVVRAEQARILIDVDLSHPSPDRS
ncbi:MAG: hypothetical protein D6705_05650 [Deltaproteobacteria bacterium]|nr:MAG: hypothetical protein D6705_05650 [Deltaproteobacteria bacterium]